jgi:hypothetical protein
VRRAFRNTANRRVRDTPIGAARQSKMKTELGRVFDPVRTISGLVSRSSETTDHVTINLLLMSRVPGGLRSDEFLRVLFELRLAALGAEIVRLSLIVRFSCGGFRINHHAANHILDHFDFLPSSKFGWLRMIG